MVTEVKSYEDVCVTLWGCIKLWHQRGDQERLSSRVEMWGKVLLSNLG